MGNHYYEAHAITLPEYGTRVGHSSFDVYQALNCAREEMLDYISRGYRRIYFYVDLAGCSINVLVRSNEVVVLRVIEVVAHQPEPTW